MLSDEESPLSGFRLKPVNMSFSHFVHIHTIDLVFCNLNYKAVEGPQYLK